MRIECVTVCIGYSDYFAETIPYNANQFDDWVVVTSPDDSATRELCRRTGIRCVLTREVWRDGDDFNKGRAIIRGLDQLASKGLVLHLDADMVLPAHFRQAVTGMAHVDPDVIYGADRVMVRGWERWKSLQASGWLRGGQYDFHCRINFPDGYPVGARWASREYGYCPIGAFQLWSGEADLYKGIHSRVYPHHHADAARGDIQHSLLWDRQKRALLPEVICAHLESGPTALGANWKGRTTPTFGPKKTDV